MVQLITWERGFAVEVPDEDGIRVCFWFYE